ncbi:hypothetical protein PIB30_023705 [Stylosanthes scabra]|uniref:Uncharacterized protein n=1 Tax=Stylosanthes scabra TaxID=79078 RepID=A0ABU6UBM0_9FABA|nr:hypothetical protein [Stylosanthes scabra]
MKFEAGLKDEIQLQVSSSETRDFAELVEQCQCVVECCRRLAVARNARSNMPSRNFGRHFAPQGRNFKSRRQQFRNFSQGGGRQNRPNAGGNGGYCSGNAPQLTSGQSGRKVAVYGRGLWIRVIEWTKDWRWQRYKEEEIRGEVFGIAYWDVKKIVYKKREHGDVMRRIFSQQSGKCTGSSNIT